MGLYIGLHWYDVSMSITSRISEYGQHGHAHHWHFATTDNDVGHIGGFSN